jgi:hypothetical protein
MQLATLFSLTSLVVRYAQRESLAVRRNVRHQSEKREGSGELCMPSFYRSFFIHWLKIF